MSQADQGRFHFDYPIPTVDESFYQGLTDAWKREFATTNRRAPTEAETSAAVAKMKTAAEAWLKQFHDGDAVPTRVHGAAVVGLQQDLTDINGYLVAHAGETVTIEAITLELRPEQFQALVKSYGAARPDASATQAVNAGMIHTTQLAIAKASGRTPSQLDGMAEEMGHYTVKFG